MQKGKNITVRKGQSVFDVLLQEFGSLNGIALLKSSNPLLLSTKLKQGDSLNINDDPIKKSIVNYYKENNIHPVSGVEEEPENSLNTMDSTLLTIDSTLITMDNV